MNGLKAFRESFMTTDLVDEKDFSDWEARKMRYALYWSYYENSAYRTMVHRWAHSYLVQYGLYKYVRSIYNPAYRLGEFWKTHIWGGLLDYKAFGEPDTSIPIITDNENLHKPLSIVLRNSNWQVKKDICSLWGSVLGDVGIKVIDDTNRKKVYLQIVHPGIIKDITLDDFGNVKGYTIEEVTKDPENPSRDVVYQEMAFRDGDNVVYQTYKNEKLYDWTGKDEPEWSVSYGFVPVVMIQHNNVGLDWGWSEFHSAHPKFREVDDLASKVSDQIRKLVDSPWLLSGVNKPKADKASAGASDPSTSNPEPGREEIPVFYGPVGSDAKALVSNMDIASASEHIEKILRNLEEDFPELNADIHNVKGDVSGRALRINQSPAETKVKQRRPNYDDALVRALQMAVAIGGVRGYPGFEGFGLESYGQGKLEFHIGDRPVFNEDPIDVLEQENYFWKTAKAANENGISIELFLRQHGWSEEKIAKVVESPDYQAKVAGLKQLTMLGNEETDEGEWDEQTQSGNED